MPGPLQLLGPGRVGRPRIIRVRFRVVPSINIHAVRLVFLAGVVLPGIEAGILRFGFRRMGQNRELDRVPPLDFGRMVDERRPPGHVAGVVAFELHRRTVPVQDPPLVVARVVRPTAVVAAEPEPGHEFGVEQFQIHRRAVPHHAGFLRQTVLQTLVEYRQLHGASDVSHQFEPVDLYGRVATVDQRGVQRTVAVVARLEIRLDRANPQLGEISDLALPGPHGLGRSHHLGGHTLAADHGLQAHRCAQLRAAADGQQRLRRYGSFRAALFQRQLARIGPDVDLRRQARGVEREAVLERVKPLVVRLDRRERLPHPVIKPQRVLHPRRLLKRFPTIISVVF